MVLKQRKLVASKFSKRKMLRVVFYIKSTFNNTIVSVTDFNGNVVAWSSSGTCGFKGARKSTPFAAQSSVEFLMKKLLDQGVKQVEVNVSGAGSGRDTAVRSIQAFPIGINVIRDITSIPYNGCRPKKKRRV
uniref:Small ribosomal subunit protein uS11c n=1 Tax=Lepocinclis playfairiana TaxID=1403386 RepID=A0A3G3LLH8_9EUGL|nr:ribosomal protein S11 [Lepocinclis playfairiana]AYQ93561.1 ribosomal protein S11 [Lepocinclis playfairiana]